MKKELLLGLFIGKMMRQQFPLLAGRALIATSLSGCALLGATGRLASQSQDTNTAFRDSLIQKVALPTNSSRTDRFVSTAGSDANEGSQLRPWATINHAGSVASPGMVIHVAPGAYSEAITTGISGTAEARIIYISDETWGAVIIAPGKDGFAWRNTGSYTDIIGFEVAGTRCGGIGLGASFQRVVSNDVHNSASGCSSSDGGSGINDYNYASQGNDILNNYVHDVGANEPSCGLPMHSFIHGIYQANAGGHVDHNVSANNCAWGIHLWHAATHASITNNTVVKNKAGGIAIGSGDAPCTTSGCPEGNDFTVVANNVVAFNGNKISGGWGLGEHSQDPGHNGPNNKYSHNLSFQNVSGDFYLPAAKPCSACITGKDPMFVSVVSGDYRLQVGSPAIGKGLSLDSSSGLPSDLGALSH